MPSWWLDFMASWWHDGGMGYMKHNAIVVSSWDKKKLVEAHAVADRIFNQPLDAPPFCGASVVSDPVPAPVNSYSSFLVGPDGSKEGWAASEEFNRRRDEFIGWLREQRYEDGSTILAWVEVQFDDDALETKVVRSSDHDHAGMLA